MYLELSLGPRRAEDWSFHKPVAPERGVRFVAQPVGAFVTLEDTWLLLAIWQPSKERQRQDLLHTWSQHTPCFQDPMSPPQGLPPSGRWTLGESECCGRALPTCETLSTSTSSPCSFFKPEGAFSSSGHGPSRNLTWNEYLSRYQTGHLTSFLGKLSLVWKAGWCTVVPPLD